MSRLSGRTSIALALTLAAVVVPCSAWFVYGSRAAGEQAERLTRIPRMQARQESILLSRQIGERLEALRQSESRRPITDYASDGSLLSGGCSYQTQIPSPLAGGPADPLIWAHFQIDDVGQMTLPTLTTPPNPSEGDDGARADEVATLEELECASAQHLAALRRERPSESHRLRSPDGVITVGPFSWHSFSVKGQPALLAVREVSKPSAVLTQGFVVLSDSLSTMLSHSIYPAELRVGPPTHESDSRVPIDGDDWSVFVDPTAAEQQAAAEGALVLKRFRWTFTLGAAGALLAGSCVVLLVRRTDRLARQRAEFAAAAAHELRTPLAGLQLYAEMIANSSGEPDQQQRYARRIAGEAARLGRVVTNVLEFAQLERGAVNAKPVAGDLGAAVRASLDNLRPALEERGVAVHSAIDDDLPAALFDRDAVHQILQNLLDNAEKYTRDAAERTVEVRVSHGDDGVRLSVIDHGQGVAPAIRSRLFSAFNRASTPDSPEGLGIGLALVRALAQSQNADVSYSDAKGGGADFCVRFAAAR